MVIFMPNTKPLRPTGPGFNRRMSKEEINELPLNHWGKTTHVISEHKDLALAVEKMQTETVLGFDTETRPAFKKGQSYPPALLQLATANEVFLFQLAPLGLPEPLQNILVDPAIIKTGVSLAYDLKELNKISAFRDRGFVDLATEAKQQGIKNHGLRGLCAVLLGFRISKSSQTSNWSKKHLTPAQIKYAATDAWVGRELYLRLQEIKSI
jgi:ribonuclease D